jgi:hypothetical protein
VRFRAYQDVLEALDASARRLYESVPCQEALPADWAFMLDGAWYTPVALVGKMHVHQALRACGDWGLTARLLLRPVDDRGTALIHPLSVCETLDQARDLLRAHL